jgi:hypothetical protein
VSNSHQRLEAFGSSKSGSNPDIALTTTSGCILTVHPVKRYFPLYSLNVVFFFTHPPTHLIANHSKDGHSASPSYATSSNSNGFSFPNAKTQKPTSNTQPLRPALKPYPTGPRQGSVAHSATPSRGVAPNLYWDIFGPSTRATNKPPPHPAPKPYPTGPHQGSVKRPNKPPPRPAPQPYPTGPHQS